jgi:hypothetical protein
MWTTSSGISTDTAIYCFRRTCRYEPLVSKPKCASRDNISMVELFDIAKRYADEDHVVDSDDEYCQRRNCRVIRPDNRRDDYRLGTRLGNSKRCRLAATTAIPSSSLTPTTGSATRSTLAATDAAHERTAHR